MIISFTGIRLERTDIVRIDEYDNYDEKKVKKELKHQLKKKEEHIHVFSRRDVDSVKSWTYKIDYYVANDQDGKLLNLLKKAKKSKAFNEESVRSNAEENCYVSIKNAYKYARKMLLKRFNKELKKAKKAAKKIKK